MDMEKLMMMERNCFPFCPAIRLLCMTRFEQRNVCMQIWQHPESKRLSYINLFAYEPTRWELFVILTIPFFVSSYVLGGGGIIVVCLERKVTQNNDMLLKN